MTSCSSHLECNLYDAPKLSDAPVGYEHKEGRRKFNKMVYENLKIVEPHGRLMHVVGEGVRNGLSLEG